MAKHNNDIMGLRTSVYCASAIVVLMTLALMIAVL